MLNINLREIKTDIFCQNSQIAEIFQNGKQQFKTMIKPFRNDMQNANNIVLFVDNDYNITGGQIGIYSPKNGINCIVF